MVGSGIRGRVILIVKKPGGNKSRLLNKRRKATVSNTRRDVTDH